MTSAFCLFPLLPASQGFCKGASITLLQHGWSCAHSHLQYGQSVQANARRVVQVFEQVPEPALRPFIKRFMVVQFPSLHRDAHLPDTSPVAAFSFRGGCRIDGDRWAPPAAFTGRRETLCSPEHCHDHAVPLATFTPVGANAFLRPSLEEFTGTTTDLAGLLGRPEELDRLHEQLAGAQNTDDA
jgi:hypothetical protein